MTTQYRIPKNQVPAEISLAGRAPLRARLFVGELAQTHRGGERPSDVLNGPNLFVPAVDGDGALILLNVESIMVATLDAAWEYPSDGPSPEELAAAETVVSRVEVALNDGSMLHGTVSYLLPASQRRLQDFMNCQDRFVILRQDAIVHLVNKRRIARVSPL